MLRAIVKRRAVRSAHPHLLLGGWNTTTNTTSPPPFRLLSSSSSPTNTDTNTDTDTDTVKIEQTKSRRRQRQGRLSSNTPESSSSIPSYKEFVHRFTVVRLYRNFLKTIRNLPRHTQDDLRAQVQREFGVHKKDTNPFNIKRALAEGHRNYAELQDLSGANKNNPSSQEDDSWINTKDEQDPRGRVGEGWPWSR
jgi:Arc/MetJ family transcription regulator